MKSHTNDFLKKYELISSTKSYSSEKIKSQKCRYCNRSVPDVSFNQDTHLLPELLGENMILTYDECDTCNMQFSDFESNFSIFIRPYITLCGVKGKKKVPDFQSRTVDRNEETRTIFKHNAGNKKELHIQRLDDYTINLQEKKATILFRKPPYVPVKIYKCLLKIGLSLMPVEYISSMEKSFLWLNGKIKDLSFIQYACMTTLNKVYFKNSYAELYKAKRLVHKDSQYPEFILIIGFANQVIQIFLPFSSEYKKHYNPKLILSLDIFPAMYFGKFESGQTTKIKFYDLSITDSILENHDISFTFQDSEINIPHQSKI